MRHDEFDRILDECLDRVARGGTVAQCLTAHPQHASRLEPLLRVAIQSREVCDFVPSSEATERARTRLRMAIASRDIAQAARRRPSLLDRLTASPLPLAAVASLAVIGLTILLVAFPLSPDRTAPPATVPPDSVDGITPQDGATEPSEPPPTEPEGPTEPASGQDVIAAVSHPNGNYIFYLSDAPNDIADFESLTITIESIDLKPRNSGPWIRIIPTETTADLALLQGDRAQEMWRGVVPEGEYTTVFVNVSAIDGILSRSGTSADVTLPSDKLHITTDFAVHRDAVAEFVFDITVRKTGGAEQQSRYALSPQADESGVGRPIHVVQPTVPAEDTPGQQQGSMGDAGTGEDHRPDGKAPGPEQGQDIGRQRDDIDTAETP